MQKSNLTPDMKASLKQKNFSKSYQYSMNEALLNAI